jgi:DNA gyrase subunit A
MAEEYGDERRTRIAPEASGDLSEEDLVPDEAVLISITARGYVKRVTAATYRAQARGGRGVTGHTIRDEDQVMIMIPARTLDNILFFSDRGKVYSEKAYQIPDAKRTGRGIPMVNVLALGSNETVTAAIAVPDFNAAEYCTMATRSGRIKRVVLSEFASVRPSGLIAMGLADGDSLNWVRLTNGEDHIVLVTENGQALRFREEQVRPMGRPAAGVIGIRMKAGDKVASMDVVEAEGDLFIVTTKGFGKRTPLGEYSVKGRGTYGVQTIDRSVIDLVGRIRSARVVQVADDLSLISTHGIIIRTKVKQISQQGRSTRGVRIMNIQAGDSVATIARIAAADLRRVGAVEEIIIEEGDQKEAETDNPEKSAENGELPSDK